MTRLTILFIFGIISSSFHWGEAGVQMYAIDEIPKELLTNAHAVVRQDKSEVIVKGEKEMVVYITKTITVLSSAGKKFGNVIIKYDGSREISDLKIDLYDAQGKKSKSVAESKIDDVNASTGNTIYDDTRAKIYIPRVIKYPYTISYRYKIYTKNTLLIPSWYPVNNFNVSVQSSSYSYRAPKKYIIKTKKKNLENHNITTKTNQFLAKNIQAFTHEEYGPLAVDLFPYVMLSPERFFYEGINGSFSNWKEYGQWVYSELLKNKDQLPEIIQAEVTSLVNEWDSPYNKAKKIYEYVQKNTEYIQIKNGIHGVEPLAAERVHALKYGDCKALTNYTQALLKLVGIESRYTEVYASKEVKKDYESDFASITQGNHIILCIPQEKDTIWVDCTSDQLPFGFVGSFTDDRKALVISEEGGEIVTTPKYSHQDNLLTVNSKIEIKADGATKTEVNIKNEGLYFFDKISLQQMKETDKKSFLQDYFIDLFSKEDLEYFDVKISKERVSVNESLKFDSKSLATASSRYIILPYKIMKPTIETPPIYKDRKQRVIIKRGLTNEFKTTYTYPKGYTIDSKPSTKTIASPYGKYEISTTFGGQNALIIKSRVQLYKGEYDKNMYTNFRKFIEEINKIERQKIVLKKL